MEKKSLLVWLLFAGLFVWFIAIPASAAVCGGSGFDLSSLTYADYYSPVTSGNSIFVIHPCGNVTNTTCTATENRYGGSMVCQIQVPSMAAYDVAVWRPESTEAITQWTPIRRSAASGGQYGVRMYVNDGAGCGSDTSFPRSFQADFLCDTTLAPGIAVVQGCAETSVCNYWCNITTSAVCTKQPQTSVCGGAGFDLTSISTADIIFKDTSHNYTYYFRPCGTVTAAQCANNPYGNVAGEAMMCQATGLNGELDVNTYDLAWWNPTLAVWTKHTNGVEMFIEDGTSCLAANGQSRALKVDFVCDPSATTPVMTLTETSTCFYVATVTTSAACTPQQIDRTLSPCGGEYGALTELSGQDLVWNDPQSTQQIIFRPCGIVANQKCQANPNTNSSMMCQAYRDATRTYDISLYRPASITYQPVKGGIAMMIADGDTCGGLGARKMTANFLCQQNLGSGANFWNFQEVGTCNYVAYINTSLVCPAPRPGGVCGAQGYDFSISNAADLQYITPDGQYIYYFQPCGQVVSTQCNNNPATSSSMMCQAAFGSLTTYDLAFYDGNLVTWTKIPNGMQMFVQDGTSCGGAGYERALTVTFLCGTGAPVLLNVSEPSTCNYMAFVQTPQACAPYNGATGIVAPVITAVPSIYDYKAASPCGGPVDLSSLSNADMSWVDNVNNYTYVLRPCGTVAFPKCVASAVTSNAMLCQADLNDATTYNLAVYNPYAANYDYIRGGLKMSLADGQYCGANPRAINVYYRCDPSATTPKFWSVVESPQCTYNAFVNTSLVCISQDFSQCGGNGISLAQIGARGDLYYRGSGYDYYINPCGTVQAPACTSQESTSNSMACQASQTSNSTYNIATYLPSAQKWSQSAGVVTLTVQDGQTCNGYDYERVLILNFLCDQGPAPYNLTSVQEIRTCVYQYNVTTGMSCSSFQSSSSSSSSLSGGAIAGIVIGSVVGAAIILGVLLVLCCGAARKGKSLETHDATGTGKFSEVESSQSNVELETHGE
jgi:hypothetical protein